MSRHDELHWSGCRCADCVPNAHRLAQDLIPFLHERAKFFRAIKSPLYAEALEKSIKALSPGARDPVRVWRWSDAPEEYRMLSPHGGDEDWVAVIPAALANVDMSWLETGTPFGCCDVSEHVLPNGDVVRIGAHS